jgi:hypothetical protein
MLPEICSAKEADVKVLRISVTLFRNVQAELEKLRVRPLSLDLQLRMGAN